MPRGAKQVESAALTFGAAAGNRVDCGSGASLDDVSAADIAVLAWIYPTAASLSGGILTKGTSALASRASFELRHSVTANAIYFTRDCSTSDATAESAANLIVTNLWQCVAATWSASALGAKLYYGTRVTPLAEVTYAASQPVAGVGTPGDNSASVQIIGAYGGGTTGSVAQRIATIAKFNRVPSLAELIAWQFSALDEPFPAVMAGCVGLWYPGNEGPTKVIDYSGYHNDGTITGATVSRGVPLSAKDQNLPGVPRQRPPLSQYMRPISDLRPNNWTAAR